MPERRKNAAFGNFMYDHFKAQGWSRAEAAQRAGVTEGYLNHLFAGEVLLPSTEVFWGFVRGWGINPLEILKVCGYLNDEAIQQWATRMEQVKKAPKLDTETQAIIDWEIRAPQAMRVLAHGWIKRAQQEAEA